jgi:hydroxymethylglutaryl-CoA lyase
MTGKNGRYELPVRKVSIFEVGPRDGLQNEPQFISTDDKIALTNMLTDAGCNMVEVTSFVHPKWVPQMADAEEVITGIEKKPGVLYNALIPNQRGLDRAIACGIDHVVTIMSASESHNKKNLNMSVEASLKELESVIGHARSAGLKVRSYIGTAYGCPLEGAIDPRKVVEIAQALEQFGSYEISLGDTTGLAHPRSAFEVGLLVKNNLKKATLAAHFHRADGIEFANVLASLEAGIDIIDSASGGLGGCPYAPGAKGNIATETLVEMLHRLGIQTGIDPDKILTAGKFAKSLSAYYKDETGHA